MSPGMKLMYRKYRHIRKTVCYTSLKAVVESSETSINTSDLSNNFTEVSGINIGVYGRVDFSISV